MTSLSAAVAALAPGMVAVLGLPYDEQSSFMRGAALAPPLIRETLHSGEANLTTETGLDLSADPHWVDLGDLGMEKGPAALQQIEHTITHLLERGVHVLSLGGDHAITYPIVRAYGQRYEGLNILHFDAHPDLYDEYDGNRYSHGCPFARIMEENLAARLLQVGIRAMNPHQQAQAKRFGVEVVEMLHWQPGFVPELSGPVYVSLDLDVLDPAFAPGVSHHEPGGLSTRDVLRIVHNLSAPIVGADIVEYNPERDVVGMTAMTAAKLFKEIVACMISGG